MRPEDDFQQDDGSFVLTEATMEGRKERGEVSLLTVGRYFV